MTNAYAQHLQEQRNLWNEAAATFDNEPDHGLLDPTVRSAWTQLLQSLLSSHQSSVLDIGCGTGSLSLVVAELGHKVMGVDLSTGMLTVAQHKAQKAGYEIEFQVMDAACPQFESEKFDVIICRHLLWALTDPAQVLAHWTDLLNPHGKLILIEGFWHTGAGLHAEDIQNVLPPHLTNIELRDLSTQSALWGGAVGDERYVISAQLSC